MAFSRSTKQEVRYAITKEEKARVLLGLPVGTRRIQVLTPAGKTKWKPLDGVTSGDKIVLRADGTPFQQTKPTGRQKTVAVRKNKLPALDPTVQLILEYKRETIESDPLVVIARRDPTSHEALKHVMSGLAEEAASISFERLEAERHGQATSHLSMRRTTVLRHFVDAYLKHMEISVEQEQAAIDLESPVFQRIFRVIVQTFAESLDEANIDPRMSEIVLNRFIRSISDEDWHSRVKLAILGNQ